MSSFWTEVTSFFVTVEKDVVAAVTAIKQGVEVVESDLDKALSWLANNSGTVAADITAVTGVVKVLGITNPAVSTAVLAANEAVSALNAYAAAANSSESKAAAVVAGYTAFKKAQSAAAGAMATATAAETPVQQTA